LQAGIEIIEMAVGQWEGGGGEEFGARGGRGASVATRFRFPYE